MAWREIYRTDMRIGSFELPPEVEDEKADRWLSDLYMEWLKGEVVPYDREYEKTGGHPAQPEPDFCDAILRAGVKRIDREAEDYEHVWWYGLHAPLRWATENDRYQERRMAARRTS